MSNRQSEDMKKMIQGIAKRNSYNEIIEELAIISQNREFRIGFVGEYGTGKSTIINALLDEDLLPRDVLPTTKAITEVKSAEIEEFWIDEELKGDDQEKIVNKQVSKEEFRNLVAKSSTKKGLALLPKRGIMFDELVLVDTPGLYSLSDMDEQITYGYLPFCDAIFVVQELGSGSLNSNTKNFIKQTKEQTQSLIRIILNKEDEISPKEREKIFKEVKKELSEIIPNPVLFSISAKDSLASRLNNEQGNDSISMIEDHITKHIKPEVDTIIDERKKNELSQIASSLIERLINKIEMIKWDDEQVVTKIKELEEKIEGYRREEKDLKNRFEGSKYRAFVNLSPLIEDYSKRFMDASISKQMGASFYQEESKRMSEKIHKSIVSDLNELLKELSDKFEGFEFGQMDINKDIVKTHLLINRIAVTALTTVALIWITPGAFGPSGTIDITELKTIEGFKNALKELKIQEWAAGGGGVLSNIVTFIAKERPIEELYKYGIDNDYTQAIKRSGYVTMRQVAESSFELFKSQISSFSKETKDNKIIDRIYVICQQEGVRSSQTMDLLKQAAHVFNTINPIDFIGRTITKWVGKDTFKKEIVVRIVATLEMTFSGVERELRDYIKEKIIKPQLQFQSDLEAEKKDREEDARDKEKYLAELWKDIDSLKSILIMR
jgi:GTPase SAR1 family protein